MKLKELINKHKLTEPEQQSLLAYITNGYEKGEEILDQDMEFLKSWEKIIHYADYFGPAAAINKMLCYKIPVDFHDPNHLQIEIFDSFIGKIPIIYVRDTDDFEKLLTNLLYKGERPANLSQTGSIFISGKTTRFVILSAKPYSNVPAAELGLQEEDDWEGKSMMIRREHECTHYFTKQVFGFFQNNLHDEMMADFIGLYNTFGFYRAEWFLRFMGIIEGSGGRIITYTEDLTAPVRAAVAEIVAASAQELERWSQTPEFQQMSTEERIKAMCRAGLRKWADLD